MCKLVAVNFEINSVAEMHRHLPLNHFVLDACMLYHVI